MNLVWYEPVEGFMHLGTIDGLAWMWSLDVFGEELDNRNALYIALELPL